MVTADFSRISYQVETKSQDRVIIKRKLLQFMKIISGFMMAQYKKVEDEFVSNIFSEYLSKSRRAI